jgi:hypothetical protein
MNSEPDFTSTTRYLLFQNLRPGRYCARRSNAKKYDPFDTQDTFEIMGDGFVILKAYAGPVSRGTLLGSNSHAEISARWERLNRRSDAIESGVADFTVRPWHVAVAEPSRYSPRRRINSIIRGFTRLE